MKSNFTLLLVIAIISISFYNCSPVPITRINLDENDVGYWQKGTGIGEKFSDDLIVEVAYSHSDKRYIYLDIAFENTGEDRILINPKEIQLLDHINGSNFRAIDPELALLSLEMKKSKQTANNKTLALVAGTAIVAGTVAAIATSDGDSGSSANTSEVDDDFYLNTYLYTDLTPQNLPALDYPYFSQGPLLSLQANMIPNTEELSFWRDFAFRKSTLFPKQRIRGLVVFLKNKFTKDFQLNIPLTSDELTFDFIHKEYKP